MKDMIVKNNIEPELESKSHKIRAGRLLEKKQSTTG